MKPFLQGVAAGVPLILGFLIAWHSVPALGDGDWQYFTAQFLVAACFGSGGVIYLFTALEMRNE